MDQASMQRFQNGNRLFEEGNYQKSKQEYQEVLKHNPQAGEVHNNLALAFYNLGQRSRAAEEYREAIRCGYEGAATHYKLGEIFLAMKRFEESLAATLKGIDLDRNAPTAPVYNNLGSAYLKIGEAANKAGKTAIAQEEFAKAAAASQKALNLDPSSTVPHLIFGHIHRLQKRYAAAIAEYDVALQHDPDVIPAHAARVLPLLAEKRFLEAFQGWVLLMKTMKKQIVALLK